MEGHPVRSLMQQHVEHTKNLLEHRDLSIGIFDSSLRGTGLTRGVVSSGLNGDG